MTRLESAPRERGCWLVDRPTSTDWPPSSAPAAQAPATFLNPSDKPSILTLFYRLVQFILTVVFSPNKPSQKALDKPLGRIAIIGAGVTGISSGAHCVAHGFDVVIYEQKPKLGGIWAAVNKTSSLQLSSFLYRFHPAVLWSKGFPVKQHEILSEMTRIWKYYHLESRTKFNYKVRNVQRQTNLSGNTEWKIDNGSEGVFDAIIIAIGTCGPPKSFHSTGLENFKGPIVHSSNLDGLKFHNQNVVVIGGGASGVEAAELAVSSGASNVSLLARSDKWFIPRNWFFSIILGCCPYQLQEYFGHIAENLILTFHYRDLQHLKPFCNRFYSDTPIVNDLFFEHVRFGRVKYIRGEVLEILPEAIKANVRNNSSSRPGDPGITENLKADIIIDATGYKRPTYEFLPDKLFPSKEYSPPNIFLQTFSTVDPTCLMTNAAYVDAVGAAGHTHIGISARMMMMFLLEPKTSPKHSEMKKWVDSTHDLHFFTYCELVIWFVSFHLTNVSRFRWMIFNLYGWGLTELKKSCQPDQVEEKIKGKMNGLSSK